MTESMQKAIDETNRRRKIQMEYNELHHITPKTIRKEIKEAIHGKETKEMTRKYLAKKTHSKADKEALIAKLEKDMRAAAKNMDFEKAIELRDMIMEIKAED